MIAMPATSEIHQVFCRNVRARRRELDLTQRELGERMGISFQQISNIENGQAQPNLAMIARIAEALDCSPSALLEFTMQT